ncbi:hypothetical protein ACFS3C_13605 [Azotobacter vinelandii]
MRSSQRPPAAAALRGEAGALEPFRGLAEAAAQFLQVRIGRRRGALRRLAHPVEQLRVQVRRAPGAIQHAHQPGHQHRRDQSQA